MPHGVGRRTVTRRRGRDAGGDSVARARCGSVLPSTAKIDAVYTQTLSLISARRSAGISTRGTSLMMPRKCISHSDYEDCVGRTPTMEVSCRR